MTNPNHAMDNFRVHVVGAWAAGGKDDLAAVLALAFNHNPACVGWSVSLDGWLLLYWARRDGDKECALFKKPLDVVATHAFVVGWLTANSPAEECRDSDVDEKDNAFEAATDEWGHGGGNHYAMLAIKPRTRWIGK